MRGGGGAIVFAAAIALAACASLTGLSGNEPGPAADAGADGSSSSGGNDSGGATDGATPSLVEECGKVAAATCARITACAPAFVQMLWGGPAACEEHNKVFCETWVSPPGAKVTLADVQSCAADIEKADCEAITARQLPASCRPKGDFAEGATCITNSQCSTALCGNVDTSGCGKCRVPGVEGADCVESAAVGSSCAAGFVCGSTGKCVVPQDVGGSCQTDGDCKRSLFCAVDNKCTTWRVENEQCSGGAGRCAWFRGFTCHPTENVCVKQPVVSPGTACNSTAIGPICLGGLCRPVNNVPTCTAFAKEGEACTDRPCIDPYKCIAGQCVRAKQSYCP